MLGVALLVHPYLLVMVAAIWASAVLRLLVVEPATGGGRLPVRLAVAGCSRAIAWWLGFIGLDALLDRELRRSSAWRSTRCGTRAIPDYSALLPGLTTTAAQGFEGLNYLGAGLLAACRSLRAARRLCAARAAAPIVPLVWLLPRSSR